MTKVITLSELVANIRCRRNGKTFLANFVNQCEFRDAVIIPPNATNGDVLKLCFNAVEKQRFTDDGYSFVVVAIDGAIKYFDLRWWNAPYKGSEG
jgi:hypothetical protein